MEADRLKRKLEMLGVDVPPGATEETLLDLYYKALGHAEEEAQEPEPEEEGPAPILDEPQLKFTESIEESKCFGISWLTPKGLCDVMHCQARAACQIAYKEAVEAVEPEPDPEREEIVDDDITRERIELESESLGDQLDLNVYQNDTDAIAHALQVRHSKLIPIEMVPESTRPNAGTTQYKGNIPLPLGAVKIAVDHLYHVLGKSKGRAMSGASLLEDLRYMYPEQEVWRRKDIVRNLHRSINLSTRGGIKAKSGYYFLNEKEL